MIIPPAHSGTQPENTSPVIQIVRALGGELFGGYGMARCPAHRDRIPSLSVTFKGGKLLVYCHAGCEQKDVIAALRKRGLWPSASLSQRVGQVEEDQPTQKAEQPWITSRALSTWQETQPATGTLVELYCRARGITIALPQALRFHDALKHPTGGFWPALVSLVTSPLQNTPLAILRTYLDRDGKAKAPVNPQKMMLGPVRGGVVQLGPAFSSIMIGEGIETCLSAMQATGRTAWAALSTSNLPLIELPAHIADVVILADGDDPGEAAACEAGSRWRREGRLVRVARPPRGLDFNDVLTGHHHTGAGHV
jgi:putative DNA primase/helicase